MSSGFFNVDEKLEGKIKSNYQLEISTVFFQNLWNFMQDTPCMSHIN